MPIDHIFGIKSLDELAEFLQATSLVRTQKQLSKLFLQNVLYRNVEEWNRTVRTCEALTILGWGELEPVQAVLDKYYNGSPWTMLVNRFGKRRYLEAVWSKRQDGYRIVEDSIILHGSDDLPNKTSKWRFLSSEKGNGGALATQGNWISRSPIWIGQTVTNCYDSSKDFVESVRKLQESLLYEMRPEVYGRAIDQLCFYFHLSYSGLGCATNYVIQADPRKLDENEKERYLRKLYSASEIHKHRYKLVPRYLFRPFRAAQGQMNISIHLTKEFSEQDTRAQKREFAKLLSAAIDEVVNRLRKMRLAYDLDALREDADKIIYAWASDEDDHSDLREAGARE